MKIKISFQISKGKYLPVLVPTASIYWKMAVAMISDFFFAPLETMIDLRHPRAVLATLMN